MDLFLKYMPVYVFNKNETNFPQDIDEYLKNCSLIKNGKSRNTNVCCYLDKCDCVLSLNKPIRKTISGEKIYSKGELNFYTKPLTNIENGLNCYLEYEGKLTNKFNDKSPVYCYRKDYKDYYELTYYLFYNYQSSYTLPLFNRDIYIGGHHQCDIENITYHISKTNDKVEYISYFQHKNKVDLHLSEIDKYNNHNVVYISDKSHASYSKPGKITRYCGLLNDYCSDLTTGIIWKPTNIISINDIPDDCFFNWYVGNYGNNGVSSFASRF